MDTYQELQSFSPTPLQTLRVMRVEFKQWLQNPDNLRQAHLSRLEKVAEIFEQKGVESPLIDLYSPLFLQPDWREVVRELFIGNTPRIHLGGGFTFQKICDFYGSYELIRHHHPSADSYGQLVMQRTVTDDGMIYFGNDSSHLCDAIVNALMFGTKSSDVVSWKHRHDVSLYDLAAYVADRYAHFCYHLPDDRVRVVIDYETYGENTSMRRADMPLHRFHLTHLVALPGEEFHSLAFIGGAVTVGIGGTARFYEHLEKYESNGLSDFDHFITIFPRARETSIVAQIFTSELFQETSLISHLSRYSSAPFTMIA